MDRLKLSLHDEILLMQKYGLDAEDWLVVQLLFLGSSDERDSDRLLEKLYANGGITVRSLRNTLIRLQEKGIILKEYKIPQEGSIFDPEGVLFNSNFIKQYFKTSIELGMELYKNYPHSYNGLDMRNVTKSFPYDGLDGLFRAYGKNIKWNPNKHKEILNILEKAKNEGLIRYGICEFVLGYKWIDLSEKFKDVNYSNVNILEQV